MHRMHLIGARLRAFWDTYSGLINFTLRHVEHSRLALSALLDFLSAVARASVIGVLSMFASLMQDSRADSTEWVAFFPSGVPAIILVSSVVLILLIVEALARYGSAQSIRHIGRVTHTSLANTAIQVLAHMNCRHLRHFATDYARMLKYVIRDALQSGIAVENIIQLFLPVMHVLMAMGLVVYFEPLISALLGLLLLLLAPIVYSISHGTSRNAKQFYQVWMQEMSRSVSKRLRACDDVDLPSYTLANEAYWEEDDACRDYLDSFDRHRLATERMSLGLSLFRAGFVVLGLLGFAWLVMEGNRSWGQLVGFTGGLIYMMNGLQSLLRTLTNLNRLYPQVRDLIHLISEGESTALRRSAPIPKTVVIRTPEGEGAAARWLRGEWLVVFSNHRVHRHDLGGIINALAESTTVGDMFWDAARFVHHRFIPSGVPLAQFIAGPDENAEREAGDLLRLFGLSPEGELSPMHLSSVVRENEWRMLKNHTRAAILLAAATQQLRQGPVFVTSTLLAWLTPDARKQLRQVTKDGFFVVVTDRYGEGPNFGDWYAWVADSHLKGLGDAVWLERNADIIAASLAGGEGTVVESADVNLL